MDRRRRALAIAWFVLVGAALAGWFAHDPWMITGTWFAALMLLVFTSALARITDDERLELPLAYRTVGAVAFALPLAGLLLVRAPDASGETYLFSPYFCVMAFLGYRVMVARGPQRILRAMVAGLILWLPLCIFLAMGCKCGHYLQDGPHWTEVATERLLFISQVIDGALIGVALLAFAPRTEWLPEARLTS